MDCHTLYPIGELARRTGAPVKTIRFYSDGGLVPPADRSPAGYRLYDDGAVARLNLLRTLRDLGLDLSTIRRVMEGDLALSDVAAAHAEALEVQIRILRLRRAVLTAVAKRGATAEETDLMHKLAKLSAAERQLLVNDFLDAAFGGVGTDSMFAGIMRSMTPELPDDPDAEQVEAWVELAELSQDLDFRAYVRYLAEGQASDRVDGEPPTLHRDLVATVRDQVAPALAGGIEPASPEANRIISVLMTRCSQFLDTRDDVQSRRQLLARLEAINDPRRERYFELLAVINGWPGRKLTEEPMPQRDLC